MILSLFAQADCCFLRNFCFVGVYVVVGCVKIWLCGIVVVIYNFGIVQWWIVLLTVMLVDYSVDC